MLRKRSFNVEVRSESKTIPVSLSFYQRTVQAILKQLKRESAEIHVLFVDDAAMRRYNRKYLKHDRTTDVIAFGYPSKKKDKAIKGELLVCLPTAKRQARSFGTSFRYEVCYYLCHGILHMMGYNDKTLKEAGRMANWQTKILKKLKIS